MKWTQTQKWLLGTKVLKEDKNLKFLSILILKSGDWKCVSKRWEQEERSLTPNQAWNTYIESNDNYNASEIPQTPQQRINNGMHH